MEESTLTSRANGDIALNKFSRRRNNRFASLIIFDMEATGFKRRPRVTELCMMAIQVDEIKSAKPSFPRVINKIQLCFNPESVIDPAVCNMTGLYNDALEQMATFKEQAALISGFLASQPQPTCLIAHNGLRFDFPLLQAELRKADHSVSDKGEVWCADSWQAFRVLDGLCAIPEWLPLKMDKQIIPLSVDKTAADQIGSNKETGTDNLDNKALESDISDGNANEDEVGNIHDVSASYSSPGKRHAQNTSEEEGDAVTSSKLTKQDAVYSQQSVTDEQLLEVYDSLFPEQSDKHHAQNAAKNQQSSMTRDKLLEKESIPSLDTQLSVTDSELFEAYDALVSEQSTPAVNGNLSQCQVERTPERSASHASITTDPKAGHLFKKEQPLLVDPKERKSVSRRLFQEMPVHSCTSHAPVSAPASRSTPECSYKLQKIYKRAFGQYPAVAHTAEDDCITLLKLILKNSSQFIDFVEENAICFDTTEPMY